MISSIKKSEVSNIIKLAHRHIKNNDIKQFKSLIEKFPWIIDFKNKKRENLLFYAFSNNSVDIIDYIISQRPTFIKEKNILNISIIQNMILECSPYIDIFFSKISHLSQEEKNSYFLNCDPQGNNLLLMAAKAGNINNLKKIILHCPDFIHYQKVTNQHGQNIAHFIASNIHEDISGIANRFLPETLRQLDNLNGFSPLMIAAYRQNHLNFNSFFNVDKKNQISFLGNELIHFAAHNPDSLVTSLLLNNKLFSDKLNKFGQSPFYISLSKANKPVSSILFKHIQSTMISSQELLASAKNCHKDPQIFKDIILNTNIALTEEEKEKFWSFLFMNGTWEQICLVNKNNSYKIDLHDKNSLKILVNRILTGKKDMIQKFNFILSGINQLTDEEIIDVSQSLIKLPINQMDALIKKSILMDKIQDNQKGVLLSLYLRKSSDCSNLDSSFFVLNYNNTIQKYIRQTLKYTPKDINIKNIEKIKAWFSIIEDSNYVWKTYGNILAEELNCFNFIENNMSFLSKEEKKQILFFTIKGILLKEGNINRKNFEFIKNYPSLVYKGYQDLLKAGKIPENVSAINFIANNNKEIFSTSTLIDIIELNIKNPEKVEQLIKKTIHLYKTPTIAEIDILCNKLLKYNVSDNVWLHVFNKLENNPRKINIYIENYLEKLVINCSETLDFKKIKQIINLYSGDTNYFKSLFIKSIENYDCTNIEFMKFISNKFPPEEINFLEFSQKLVDESKFSSLLQLSAILGDDFEFNKIKFIKLDWNNIEKDLFDSNYSFFDFIKKNQNHLSEKQINQIIFSVISQIEDNPPSFSLLYKLLDSLDKNIYKIEDDGLLKISNYVLKKHNLNDIMAKMLSEENFDHIFSLISQNKNADFLQKIKENENFSLLNKELQIFMNKEILDNQLTPKNANKSNLKRIKV